MPSHTPTPWTVLSPSEWANDQWVIPGVALCGNGELSEANAKLIGRAVNSYDDMLDALRAVRLWDAHNAPLPSTLAGIVNSAIAKAEAAE